jgi:hypothetical protein
LFFSPSSLSRPSISLSFSLHFTVSLGP